jgi:hypothetical protein
MTGGFFGIVAKLAKLIGWMAVGRIAVQVWKQIYFVGDWRPKAGWLGEKR